MLFGPSSWWHRSKVIILKCPIKTEQQEENKRGKGVKGRKRRAAWDITVRGKEEKQRKRKIKGVGKKTKEKEKKVCELFGKERRQG